MKALWYLGAALWMVFGIHEKFTGGALANHCTYMMMFHLIMAQVVTK
jgi:hypothetical protein